MSSKTYQTIYNYPTTSNSSPYVATVVGVGAGGGGGSSYGNVTIPTSWTTHGSSQMYLTSSGTYTNISTTTSIQANLIISGKHPTLSTDMNKIDIDEMAGIIATLKDVFFIIPKHQKLIDENPTLKDAWDQYETVLRKNLNDPELKEVYNQYKTLEALSKEENK
jgi:hypothetical protein